ncbi:MAG: hypothetical protein H7Y31_17330 [Chitinophagaceae bacterium]|nr:hypothetical protein [Chitinophagaceae bacterium]
MKKVIEFSRSKIIISLITLSVFFFVTCIDESPEKKEAVTIPESTINRQDFAGSASCASCHKDIYQSHLTTAHALTSRLASAESIAGSFEAGQNMHSYNSNVLVAMEKRDSGFFQVEYVNGVQKRSKRFDISIGSGTMGQSFLTWDEQGRLFQLPITFFSAANQWSNSPGFANKPTFNRVITSRCLECHTTFAQTLSLPKKEPEQFNRNNMILGVECEKCHGPAASHVAFQTSNPTDTTGKNIVNPATLSRQQNLDLCALCHGGRLQKTKPSFEFVVGEELHDFFKIDTATTDPNEIDVHGNQYGLLRASECFRMSEMTCKSCHNTHQNEKNKPVLFSQRCMSCHTVQQKNFCTFKDLPSTTLIKNCIDCHMPQKPSRAISVFVSGQQTPMSALIRSHYVAKYPDETKKFMNSFRKK